MTSATPTEPRGARDSVLVIGAGVGGLCAAIDLAAAGLEVTLLERAAVPGGKVRTLEAGGRPVDSGPTVFTMRWVFDALFARAGSDFEANVALHRADPIARHAWQDGSRLDLHAELAASADAIGRFAGAAEARGFQTFMVEAARTFDSLRDPFLTADKPNPLSLARRAGYRNLWRARPLSTLMRVLAGHFRDPRLQQLFGRYATYCGASPYLAPATLTLIAHVEQEGVYRIQGGMQALVSALERLARRLGVLIHLGEAVTDVYRMRGGGLCVRTEGGTERHAGSVVANADAGGIAAGALGAECARYVRPVPRRSRSLSALTWSLAGSAQGFELSHHNVFFSRDYRQEFHQLLALGRVPRDPTVYVCAQDRGGATAPQPGQPERLLCLVNAPACGDRHRFSQQETESCFETARQVLAACGLTLTTEPDSCRSTTPTEFAQLFPGSGGAIYGRASHGWLATFLRPGNRTRMPGLYLAGGSVHPGPGVPMAALSGRRAALAVLEDLTSRSRSRTAVMPGGTSTR